MLDDHVKLSKKLISYCFNKIANFFKGETGDSVEGKYEFKAFVLIIVINSHKCLILAQIVRQRMRFPTFGEVLKFNWITKKRNIRASNSEPCFFIVMMLFEYYNQCRGRPSTENREVALKHLKTARDIIHNNYALPENKIPDEILPMLFSEASPVASMIGGCLSQDVIKAITKRGIPMKNFAFYNPLTDQVRVEVIGKTKMTFPSDEGWEEQDESKKVWEVDDEDPITILSVVEAR